MGNSSDNSAGNPASRKNDQKSRPASMLAKAKNLVSAKKEHGSLAAAPNAPTPPTGQPAFGQKRPSSSIFSWFLLAMLFLSLYLMGLLVWPFLNTIIMACILAALAYPLYHKIRGWLKGRGITAALLTVLFLVIMVALPLSFFTAALIEQAGSSSSAITQWLSSTHLDVFIHEEVTPVLAWFNEQFALNIAPEQIRANLLKFASEAGQAMLGWGTNLVGDTVTFVTDVVLVLLIMFFLFKDGSDMLQSLKRLFPMREEQTNHILENLRRMSKAVLVGGLSVAGIQGLIGGIGLAIVGIPGIFWGTIMAFTALVPVVGTALVWMPAVGYLLIMGEWGSAVFLLAWCGLLVTSIDSFLRPVLMRGGSNISILFMFMSVFGGIKAFGMLGLIYGPLILSFGAVMLTLYAEEYRDTLFNGKLNSKPGLTPAQAETSTLDKK